MSAEITQLKRDIMRRVYYVYALRLTFHRLTLSLAVFGLSLYALGKLVFVERVVDGFLNIPVKEIVPHAISVLSYADALTLVVFGACVVASLSIGVNLLSTAFTKIPRLQLA